MEVRDGKAMTINHEGPKWTVRVAKPDGKMVIALVASMPGYNSVRQEWQPSPGETRYLRIRLKPFPAVYSVELDPLAAVLEVSDSKTASITRDAWKWTVKVNEPDGKTAIVLVAAMPGYSSFRQDLQPIRGETRDLLIRLKPSPAVYSVELEPSGAVLEVSDREAASVARDGRKWTVKVDEPNGRTAIALVASMPGYNSVRRELQPSPGETRDVPIRLKPSPAVYSLNSIRQSALEVSDSTAANVTRDGRKWSIKVNEPNEKMLIVLLATMPGYTALRQSLQPVPGETRSLPLMRLERLPDRRAAGPTPNKDDATAERSETNGPLSGTWQASSGPRFLIEDKGKELRIELNGNRGKLRELGGKLSRTDKQDNSTFQGTLQVVFQTTARRFTVRTKAVLDGPNTLRLHCSNWPVDPWHTKALDETWTREQ